MRTFFKLVLALALLTLAVLVLPVAALRWLPVPTSAFMLASDVKPVRYQWVDAAQIPDAARRAVVASEDQKFFEHRGFDIEAMQKAHANNQKKGRRIRGASTISQQTAKNLFLWSGGGYFRKGVEAVYTVLIEALWSKERILTVYLNIAEFGPGLYGVEAASQAYFNKPAAKLGVNEAARLAAVLPNPAKWKVMSPGPYVQKRTAWIMGQMGYGARRPEPEPEPPPGLEPMEESIASTPAEPAPEVDAAAEAELREAAQAESVLQETTAPPDSSAQPEPTPAAPVPDTPPPTP